ncbi:uncharacterized protein LOC117649738 [Thrips palmi]|uniref:Uncharacterized protein LOC117649738 n=1 Tax=Thrips palmi TaxID=161013 RepID=A0A6P8ZTW1_THRPL|nr:uncharacterized protein LOC117649738 [Thrips palmi]
MRGLLRIEITLSVMQAAHGLLMLPLRSVSLCMLLLLLYCDYGHCKPLNTFAGPFIAYAHRFDTCPSDGTFVYNVRVSHFNPAKPFERQTVTGNASMKEDMNDSMWGRFTVDNEPVSWEFPKFKVMPYGHYRLTIKMGPITSREVQLCCVVDCEVIPRPS